MCIGICFRCGICCFCGCDSCGLGLGCLFSGGLCLSFCGSLLCGGCFLFCFLFITFLLQAYKYRCNCPQKAHLKKYRFPGCAVGNLPVFVYRGQCNLILMFLYLFL